MINEQLCPICKTPAARSCDHLALAVEARDFVRRCVEACHGERPWQSLCKQHLRSGHQTGDWSPEQEDFMWLETAFCQKFLKRLIWFGSLDYEWRTGRRGDQGGFWVLLWSKDPRRLWWELRDEIERQTVKDQATKA
jgi:hypothetical protein